jgi:hypothetical protein
MTEQAESWKRRRPAAPTVVAVCVAAALVVAAVVAALAVTGRLVPPGRCAPADRAACTRVLFVGNSYTYVNDLPAMFADLARSGGRAVEVGTDAPGGATLADHAASGVTRDAIGSAAWDVVVLQEQSVLPVWPTSVAGSFEPAAHALADAATSAGARPVLFETWAHRDGWPDAGLAGYASMQRRISAAYRTVGRDLGLDVAPIGTAWAAARASHPEIDLWQPDGSHPTAAGTYLAACVLYASLFGLSPEGLGGGGGLPAATVRVLQETAAANVLPPQ